MKFAVYLRDKRCLSKSGSIDYEPMPSSRDDEYLAAHRFDTFEEAHAAAVKLAQLCLEKAPTQRPLFTESEGAA